MKTEESLHQAVVNYLKVQYPKVEFRTDFAAGTKMTMGQAVKHKKIQKRRAWPDLFIAEPKGVYHGLFIELKAEGQQIQRKNGNFVSDHVREQAEVIAQLLDKGYSAWFAVGFDQAKSLIDSYMDGSIHRLSFIT